MKLIPALIGALMLLIGGCLTGCSLRAVAVIETGDAVQGKTNFETGPNATPTPVPSLP